MSGIDLAAVVWAIGIIPAGFIGWVLVKVESARPGSEARSNIGCAVLVWPAYVIGAIIFLIIRPLYIGADKSTTWVAERIKGNTDKDQDRLLRAAKEPSREG